MGMQSDIFLSGEGNAWFHRNKLKVRTSDIVPALIKDDIEPSYVLEFGCADGWNLANLKKAFPEAKCYGVDPSKDAINRGRIKYPDIGLGEGTATSPWDPYARYDLIIYGFCLYVCDPHDLARIVQIGDSMLNDYGHLVIQDFDPDHPHRVPYAHEEGVFSYKMDYSKLWLANPAYSLVSKTKLADGSAVWVLKKDVGAGWPLEDWPLEDLK